MGLRPLVPPTDQDSVHGSPAPRGKTLCKPHEAESSAASAFFGFAVLFRFFALLPVANPAGGWRGHVGGLSPPARCAVSVANLLFPQKQRASCRLRRPAGGAGFPPGHRCAPPAEASPSCRGGRLLFSTHFRLIAQKVRSRDEIGFVRLAQSLPARGGISVNVKRGKF